jgi:hypothetical protein
MSCGFGSGAKPPNIYADFGFSFQILLLPDPSPLRSLSLPRRSLPRRGRQRRRRAVRAPPWWPRPPSDATGPCWWPPARLPLGAASSCPSAVARGNPSCRVLAGRAYGSALLSSAFLSRRCRQLQQPLHPRPALASARQHCADEHWPSVLAQARELALAAPIPPGRRPSSASASPLTFLGPTAVSLLFFTPRYQIL